MLVKELIAELQKLDQDAPIYGWNHEFCDPVDLPSPCPIPETMTWSGQVMPAGYVLHRRVGGS